MGCIVEPIRYPYRTTMRFYKDSAIETPVCWYFCSPEAKPLGCYTRFGSGLYGKDYMDRWEGTGETPFGPLDFRANCCKYPGKARIGTAEQFAEGVSINDAPPAVRGLVNCSDPPLSLSPIIGPYWLDLAAPSTTDATVAFPWSVYTPFGTGYIQPFVRIDMTSTLAPSLNGSFVASWHIEPDNIILYSTQDANLFPTCFGTPLFPQIQVLRASDDGSFVDVIFAPTEFPICDSLRLFGSPTPASYSGSAAVSSYGAITITITGISPFVPPPYPPE